MVFMAIQLVQTLKACVTAGDAAAVFGAGAVATSLFGLKLLQYQI